MSIGARIEAFWDRLTSIPEYTVGVLIVIIAVAICYYFLIKFMLNNGSKNLVKIFVLVLVVAVVSFALLNVQTTGVILAIPLFFAMLIFILYSIELKRVIWAGRNSKLFDYKNKEHKSLDKEKVEKSINEIIKALQNMSKNDVGAIIVLANGNVPSQIIDSGVILDSDISSALIESVFFPKTPLHDGAMIINSTRIVAAGCFLPLSQNLDGIPKDFGSRHRAGLGVTESLDVVSLIVSEETGIISIAKAGKVTRYANYEMLKEVLDKYYWEDFDGYKK